MVKESESPVTVALDEQLGSDPKDIVTFGKGKDLVPGRALITLHKFGYEPVLAKCMAPPEYSLGTSTCQLTQAKGRRVSKAGSSCRICMSLCLGTKCPGTKGPTTKCPGTKCPGTKCFGTKCPGTKCLGTKCPGTKCPRD